MSEGNAKFGTAGACLHCLVRDLIEKHSPKAADGEPILHSEEILRGLLEVAAEIIASQPDRNQRRRILDMVNRELRAWVSDKIASGEHPRAGPIPRPH